MEIEVLTANFKKPYRTNEIAETQMDPYTNI